MQTFPLIGRDHQLRQIRESLEQSSAGGGVVIFGVAGVGKTRLAQEAVAALGRRSRVYPLVGTPAAQAVPLAALQDAFPGIDPSPEAGASQIRARLAGAVRRPVLFVDDAQWLDTATQAVLHQLVRTRQVRVVATVRDDMAVPPSIQDLWKNGHLTRIDLVPLDAAESGALVEAAVGAPVEACTAAEFYARSQGSPFALRELVREAVACEVLVVRNGIGHIHGPLPPSRRLLDIVAGNLQWLAPGTRSVLDIVAVAERLPLAMLRRLCAEPDLRSAEAHGVIRLCASRLDSTTDPHVVTVGHPLYAEAALTTLTRLAHRSILERLADAATEFTDASPTLALRAASWSIETGRPVHTEHLLNATRLTHRALDAEHAARFAGALWRQRPGAETGLLYAMTLSRQLKFDSQLEVLRSLERFDLTERERVARAVLANEALVRMARHDEAIAALIAVEPSVTGHSARAHLTAKRALTASVAGRTRQGLEIIMPLAQSMDPDDFREAVAVAPAMLALDGRAEEGLQMVKRAELLDETTLSDPEGYLRIPPQSVTFQGALCLMYAGRLLEATEQAEAGLCAAEEHGSGDLLAGWLNLLGRVQLTQGHAATAVHTLGRVLAEASQTSGGAQRAIALNALVEAHALLGQANAARASLDRLLEQPGDTLWHPAGLAELARGHLAFAEGEQADAWKLFDLACQRAALSNAAIALTAAHALARFGDRRRGWALARDLPPLQGPLAAHILEHLRALAEDNFEALLRAAVSFEELGADLFAAEAAGAAIVLATRQGDARQQTAARRLGHRLMLKVERIRTPDLMALSHESTASLTERERQIAMMASAGMTSQNIASTLTVSIRTIDNHLLRVYKKLGLYGRRELPQALRPQAGRGRQ